jgi:phosphatidylserine decarboxylase
VTGPFVFSGVVTPGGYNTGGMRIDRAGLPFVGGAAVLALLTAVLGYPAVAIPFAVLGAFFLYFFRDPDRGATGGPDDVLSPADGRVLVAGPAESAVPPGAWQQVSIFLSPLDVHVNRIPVAGRVTKVSYRPGRFLPAYRAEAAAENERNEIWIERGSQVIVCRQVVGVLARRIVCRIAEGATVATGQRYGIMKFGSRMDLYLPLGTRLAVEVGDRVRSGETRLATLPPAAGKA